MARPANLGARAAMEHAARRAFAQVGPVGARVEDIARAAGLSKAAFYNYFESKPALFDALVSEFFEALTSCSDERHAEVQALSERIGACGAEDWAMRSPRLMQFSALDHAYTLRFLRVLWDWRDMVECLLHHAAAQRDQIDAMVASTLSTLTERLDQAMRNGWLRGDVDPELASDVLVGAYLQVARRMFRLESPPDFEVWARSIEIIINEGLRPRQEAP